jgi:hypothetical protein
MELSEGGGVVNHNRSIEPVVCHIAGRHPAMLAAQAARLAEHNQRVNSGV